MKSNRPRPSNGFSLIELIISVAIFGVLLAVALPNFRQWTTDTQVRNHAAYVFSGLQKAKAEAIRHNYNARFQFVSNMNADCTIVATGSEWLVSHGDPTLPAASGGCARAALPDMISLRDNNDPIAPSLQADLDETDLDGDGVAGPSQDVDGDGATGTVAAGTVQPVLLVKGFRENQSTVQAQIVGLNPVDGTANANISTANQVICFNGSGQLSRILRAVGNGACTNSQNPSTTDRVSFWITISDPTAGTCVDAGGTVRCLRIQVSPTGDIRNCDPALTDVNDPRRCL